mgnify:FL=1
MNWIYMAKIIVKEIPVSVIRISNEDYISLTDMLKAKDGEYFFSNWLRNRNTVEFLGIWEKLNNPAFNCVEFDIIKSQAGLNSYRLSVKEWMQKQMLLVLFQRQVAMVVLMPIKTSLLNLLCGLALNLKYI